MRHPIFRGGLRTGNDKNENQILRCVKDDKFQGDKRKRLAIFGIASRFSFTA